MGNGRVPIPSKNLHIGRKLKYQIHQKVKMKHLLILATLMLTSCSVIYERTLIEGDNNKITDETHVKNDADVDADAKVSTI
jgi:hypothetical protein